MTEEQSLHLVTMITGVFAHAGAKDKIAKAGPGNQVTLLRDRNNKYDKQAVQVLIDGMLVGYVPMSVNQPLADAMDAGKPVRAVLDGTALHIEVTDDRDDDAAA